MTALTGICCVRAGTDSHSSPLLSVRSLVHTQCGTLIFVKSSSHKARLYSHWLTKVRLITQSLNSRSCPAIHSPHPSPPSNSLLQCHVVFAVLSLLWRILLFNVSIDTLWHYHQNVCVQFICEVVQKDFYLSVFKMSICMSIDWTKIFTSLPVWLFVLSFVRLWCWS